MKTGIDRRCVIMITGRSREDRTAFMRMLYRAHRRRRQIGGFITEGDRFLPNDASGSVDVCFIGDIGAQVPPGRGFRCPRFFHCGTIVFGIEKTGLGSVVEALAMDTPTIVDLDTESVKRGLRIVKQRLSRMDADRIGAAAGLIGLMEAGLGSTLHAYRVPLKGHILSSLENLMLIHAGKILNGRGLVRIAFISAMLKAFSPMGSRVRPMLYIFFQGTAFALPVHVFGWNAGTALAGSLLLGWLTLGVSFAVDYLTFGVRMFHAFEGAAGALSTWLGIPPLPLSGLVLLAFVARAVVSLTVGVLAYFGNPFPFVHRLISRKRSDARRVHIGAGQGPRSLGRSPSVSALWDLFQARFVVGFLFSVLLMWFFADLTGTALVQIAIRGLVISYLGFLVLRRVDVRAVGARLDRIFKMNLEESLPTALAVVDSINGPAFEGDAHSLNDTGNDAESAVEHRSQDPIEATYVTSTLPIKQKG